MRPDYDVLFDPYHFTEDDDAGDAFLEPRKTSSNVRTTNGCALLSDAPQWRRNIR